MRSKLLGLCRRLEEIDAMLASPEATNDMNRFRDLSCERAEIEPLTIKMKEYEKAEADIAAAKELAQDPDMRELAQEEIQIGEEKLQSLEKDMELMLLPTDPNDKRNIYLEIRAGTGGDESALFAGDLLRMYMRYAERQGWKVEIASKNQSDLGGYKEVICRIIGEGAYSKLKFESGGHRVQRVPETEAAGRIHTSACTVAVLPELDEVEAVTCASMCIAPQAPVVSTCKRQTRPCVSRTFRQDLLSNAKTSAVSTKTRIERWRFLRVASMRLKWKSNAVTAPANAKTLSVAAIEASAFVPTTIRKGA